MQQRLAPTGHQRTVMANAAARASDHIEVDPTLLPEYVKAAMAQAAWSAADHVTRREATDELLNDTQTEMVYILITNPAALGTYLQTVVADSFGTWVAEVTTGDLIEAYIKLGIATPEDFCPGVSA